MVKVLDSSGQTQDFEQAEYFMVTKEGVLVLLKNAIDTSIANQVAAFGPGNWHSVLKERPQRAQAPPA
jgi:hypothetical protein